MRSFLFIIFFTICYCQVDELQEKTHQFFTVNYQTYEVLLNNFKTVIIYLQDEEFTEEQITKYQMVIKSVYKKKNNDTSLIFCKGNWTEFAGQNHEHFSDMGIHISHYNQLIQFDQIEDEQQFVQKIIDLIQPKMCSLNNYPEVQAYINNPEYISGLLILEEDKHVEIYETFQSILISGDIKITGINYLCVYYGGYFEQFKAPTFILKVNQKYPIEYDGDYEDGKMILKFVKTASLPILSEITTDNLDKIFNGYSKASIHFLQAENSTEAKLKEYSKAALEFQSVDKPQNRVVFTYCKWECNVELWKSLGLVEEDAPKIILTEVDYELYFLKKYLFKGEISSENIQEFIQNYREGKLKKHYMSETIPEQQEIKHQLWKKIVSLNWEQEILNNDENVLVLYWTSQNEELFGKYNQFVKESITEFHQAQLKFLCMDISINERDEIKISRVPSLVLYLKGQKNKGHQYIGGGLTNWLQSLLPSPNPDL